MTTAVEVAQTDAKLEHIEAVFLADDEAVIRLVGDLENRLPQLLEDVADQLSDQSPGYAMFLREHRDEVFQACHGVMPTLVSFGTAALRRPGIGHPEVAAALFEEVGADQCRRGQALADLLSAYRVGALTSWRYISQAALDAAVSQLSVTALAEALFAFVDQVSSATTRGYLREHSEAVAARERARDELAELLLYDRATLTELRRASVRADWPLPAKAAVVVVDASAAPEVADAWRTHLDPSWLPFHHGRLLGAVVPDPEAPAARRRTTERLCGVGAVVGRAVRLQELPVSEQVAGLALRLRDQGVVEGDPLFVDDHLDAVIVHQDERLLEVLRERVLSPLDGCTPATRDRLVETLRAWVRHPRDRRAMAAELHVHPQTVGYRVTQLRQLFGDALDDADHVRRLTLALSWPSQDAVSHHTHGEATTG